MPARSPSVERSTPETSRFHRASPTAVAGVFDVDSTVGLASGEAARRLERHGRNRLAEPQRRPAWRRFADQFANPLVAVLAGAAVLAGVVGDLKDAFVIAGVLILNAVLGYVQEGRAENALAALEQMLALRVTVRRDGRALDIHSDEVVPGDIVLLEAGDRVPADGRIVMASAVAADESMLTGESVPANKRPDPIDEDEPALGDRRNELFMNTTLVRGRAEMIVTGTGMNTEVGQIAEMLATAGDTHTPLEKQLHTLGNRLMLVVLVAVGIVLTLALLRGTEIGEALLEAVALGVAAIPEGLPAVVTVTLAVGVSQMAKRHAIVRRLASVETLGSTTVICTDKTGTLTRNQMTPVEVWHAGSRFGVNGTVVPTPPPSLGAAMQVAVHASDASLAEDGDHVGDPTEIAVLLAAQQIGINTDAVRRDAPRAGELPFDPAAKLMATVHTDGNGGSMIAVKGAPDVLVAKSRAVACSDGEREFDQQQRGEIEAALTRFAERGQRVLAVASKRVAGAPLTEPEDISDEIHGLTLEALVAMIDPPRDGVPEAVALCGQAGIAVKMITGDHPGTAAAIARDVGIRGHVVTGHDLDTMSDDALAEQIDDIGVCARVSPEHKVRIVDALRANGEVVAMTGDGVNDAAALRRADVGIAMGIAGTEVTKEAADMVLADDDFTTIVTAVEHGRTIYDNILTFVRFQLTTNIAAITTILAAGIIGLPSPFTALQILFVNLIADGPPAMALGVDHARKDVMRRRPRTADRSILDMGVLASLLPMAVIMAVATLAVLTVTDETTQVTMAFTTFVLLQLGNVLAVRGGPAGVFGRHMFTNRWLWAAVGLVIAVQVAVVHLGFLQSLFDTTALSLQQWLIAGALLTLPLLTAEAMARLPGRMARRMTPRSSHAGR